MSLVDSFRKKIYSGDNIVNLTDVRYLPRWTILLFDLVLLMFSIFITYFILSKLHIYTPQNFSSYFKYGTIIGINLIFMFLLRTFAGIIRHSTFVDLFKLLSASFFTLITLVIVNVLLFSFTKKTLLTTAFLGFYSVISFLLLFMFRLFVKEFFQIVRELKSSINKKRILILGIDEQAVAVAKTIIANHNLDFKVTGFLTKRTDSKRANLLGKPILLKNKFEKYSKEDLAIDGVVVIKDMMTKEEMNDWVNLFLEKDLNVFKAPSVEQMQDADSVKTIKNLQIEDLLNRKPIKIENDEIYSTHYQKSILITGGAGSIGSEIVRQVAQFSPSLIVILDQAETPLYEMELEMRASYPNINFKFVLADISNKHRLEPLFREYQFSMVYHAAAYKHVPLVEENPHEGILVNIFGSKNVAMLSSKYNVLRFVMISTDKAVNPTNVMGASKRAAELLIQSLQNVEGNTTKFITTRFGNVLGSNGSVIPHFKKQIENGGPVTITHPDIVRYFMTIPEACELVLQAATMGSGGEIYVFDMGKPVKILDLAKRMIKLSGLDLDTDIKIIFTGLRPGEKLFEELLSDGAKTLPTHHEKILISKDPCGEFSDIETLTNRITKAALRRDKVEVVQLLKIIVPEFKSNNSVYEALDK
ncbi:polysaccharide biosynthesis protein [Frigoriflavimonas asaccharolytica]|uniref:FlaA1/EpsC-like NDP-sugar epimerase n=1 Tax=Frigoriflavimonas asaccharolytica TaxID=2735899 RepID=A0A8J8G937_9FLAO|nr:nucleoside-diphosphate sugar epimerase/dehydratase [Frigoriflavimonas asaccharolytica]NRS91237.1 FlaA1/EpsC-like NDP-sugar epimerase [Frigoriflavimonas asaccharolytica]